MKWNGDKWSKMLQDRKKKHKEPKYNMQPTYCAFCV